MSIVHAAKLHSDILSLVSMGKDLVIHHSTCKYYDCEVCQVKIRQFTSIKVHFKSTNQDYSKIRCGVRNVKPSRENFDIYDRKFHHITSLFPELK